MNIAYMRVSTKEQRFNRQIDAFKERGIEIDRFYEEKKSGKDAKSRPQLNKMLREVQDGDTVYITELSRLGRSVVDLSVIAEQLRVKGVSLVSLKENMDFGSPTGKLMYGILASMAEFERTLIRERQAEGIAAAKKRGVVLGRKPVFEITDEVCKIFGDYYLGTIKREEAIKRTGMSAPTFSNKFSAWRKEKNLPDKRTLNHSQTGRPRKKTRKVEQPYKYIDR